MRKLSVAILALTVLSAALLLAVPVSSAAGETVKIYYKADPDINANIPREIPKGGDLTIVASSQRYDLERSGIMFYECDSTGKPIRTTSLSLIHSFTSENNTVTWKFRDVPFDIEVSFTELVEFETTPVVPGDTDDTEGPANAASQSDLGLTTIIMLAIMVLGIIMLAVSTSVTRMLAPSSMKSEGKT